MKITLMTILLLLIGTRGVAAQDTLEKGTTSAGSTRMTGNGESGHLSIGISVAGRIEGDSGAAWLGFYPIRRPTPSSVNEGTEEPSAVYPNPAEYHVTFPLSGHPESTTIVNERGEVADHLAYTIADREGTVDIRSLPSGTYALQIQYADRMQRFRFVIQR